VPLPQLIYKHQPSILGESPELEPGKLCLWSESGKKFPTPANFITQPLIAPGTIWLVCAK
jgi:hypothetical protein